MRPNQGAGAYEGLISNDGKELMAFSDYPMPEQYSMVNFSSEFLFESIDLINLITTMMTTMSFVSRQQQIKMFNSINSIYFETNLF